MAKPTQPPAENSTTKRGRHLKATPGRTKTDGIKIDKRQQAREVFRRLNKLHADAKIALVYSTPLELLIATILSAQCTDIKVNEVTKLLFSKFKKPTDYVKKRVEEIEEIVRPTGFFRQKAKNIRATVEAILAEHGGNVPQEMEDLVKLPGVGRKTANVVLGNAFKKPGLPVDTHVQRLTNRLGITSESDPVKIELELNELLDPKDWCQFSHVLIFHGRRVCVARKPKCEICPLTDVCPYFKTIVAPQQSK